MTRKLRTAISALIFGALLVGAQVIPVLAGGRVP